MVFVKLDHLRIIVDERERKSGIPDLLKSIGMGVEMKTLPIGDYIVAPETIVERKSIKDLMASIFDGRLYDQCTRLKENFEHPIVLVEGNVDEIEEITDNPLVFYGALSRVTLEFKIPIIPTPSASHTAKLLVALCSKKDGPKGPYLKKIKKSSNLETQQLSTLCSLPGIGEKFAVRMLEKFGTPLKVFSATTSELAKVEGLGESRAKKIKNMLITKNKLQKESNQKTLT
ncbi:ERCC4 domain-containing protein [Nitrosopumilus sp.]|nr:ERCC4 domain-containing protein [Nitrosopumilus sp.]